MSIATFNSRPMPPAPTRPRTTEERTDFSSPKSVVVMKAGLAAGMTAQKMVSMRRTPCACSASAGPLSTSSMASAKKRPQNPAVSTAIASVPAKGPRPTAITKMSAQTRSGTVRKTATTARAATLTQRLPSCPLGGEDRQGDGYQRADGRAGDGHLEGLDKRGGQRRQPLQARREGT